MKAILKYFRNNFLAYIVIALFIAMVVLMVLPGAHVTISQLAYSMQLQEGDNMVAYNVTLNGTQSFDYSVFDILGGVNNKVLVNGAPTAFTIISWFIPFNVWLGLGILLLGAAVVLEAFDNRVIRIVGAGVGLVGGLLTSIFLFNQQVDSKSSVPVVPYPRTTTALEYTKAYDFGVYVVLVMAILVTLAVIAICVIDNIKRYRFEKSEYARYLRGGI